MKTLCTFLIIAFLSLNIQAQDLPNNLFSNLSTGPCPFDPSVTVTHPDHWLLYQTQNDFWDGPIDSTVCISVSELNWGIEVDLNQIDPQKSLFIRCDLDDNTKILLTPNTLYTATTNFRTNELVAINQEEDCPNNLCTGLIMGIEIPDSTGTGKATRMYTASGAQNNLSTSTGFCYATEKFDENYIKEFILKITFDDDNLSGKTLQYPYAFNSEIYDFGDYRIYSMEVPEWTYNGSTYETFITDFADSEANFLLMYTDITYPLTSEDISYIEATPAVNQPTQEIINIYIEGYEVLTAQPFTQLRGGLIDGSDSVRHQVNIINNGGTICMEPYIEFVFDGSTHYFHQGGGAVEFNGLTSCMLFRAGGTLNITANTTFQYGNGGEGLLAISDGSTINIGKNASLEIDNHMILKSFAEKSDQQVFMELNPGASLRFGENAKLSHVGNHPDMRLNVYMNGGILDDWNLSPSEKRLINKIYPEPESANGLDLKIVPNPVGGNLRVSVISGELSQIHLTVLEPDGKEVSLYQVQLEKGINNFTFPVSHLPAGIYFIRATGKQGVTSTRFMKL